MSIAICRIQKIGSPKDIAGIQIHNRRERDHSNTNPDINHTRSNLNYTLTVKPDESMPDGFVVKRQNAVEGSSKPYNALVEKRIRDAYTGKKAVRKDAVRCCEVLFTASGDFFYKNKHQTEDFFKSCMRFAAKRFGAENIIAATVHMDEATPHLHLDFVPLTADGRLSAKSVLGGRKEMQKLQDDFYVQVGKKYGLKRGSRADIDNPEAEKPRKHLSTQRYKAEADKEIKKIEFRLEQQRRNLQDANKRLDERRGQIFTAKNELKELNEQLAILQEKWEKYEKMETSADEVDLDEKPVLMSKSRVSVLIDRLNIQKDQARSYFATLGKIQELSQKELELSQKELEIDQKSLELSRKEQEQRELGVRLSRKDAEIRRREQRDMPTELKNEIDRLEKIKNGWKDRAISAESQIQELKSTIEQKEQDMCKLRGEHYRKEEKLRKEHQLEIEKRDKVSENLRSQITDLKNQTTDLKKKMDWSVSVLKQLMMALKALLLDHEPDRFKADLTLKQQALVKTLINIAAGETRNMGRPEDSDEIKNRAVITKPVFDAIQKQIERDLKQEARLKEMESPKPQIDQPMHRR